MAESLLCVSGMPVQDSTAKPALGVRGSRRASHWLV